MNRLSNFSETFSHETQITETCNKHTYAEITKDIDGT